MKLLDLFSGIGGFSLAAHWMGWETIAFVEKDNFCQKVLNKNFAGVPIYDDITTFSGEPFRGRCDIITGGFPCQPFSVAGEQKGSADERHLFPEMLRVISEVRPNWVVAENVRGLLNIEYGDAFEEICSSLENLGYSVQPFIIPACAVNAPHRRDRIWFVAHTNSIGERTGFREVQKTDGKISERNDNAESGNAKICVASNFTSNSDHKRCFGRCQSSENGEREICKRCGNDKSFSKPPICESQIGGLVADTTEQGLQVGGQKRIGKFSAENFPGLDGGLELDNCESGHTLVADSGNKGFQGDEFSGAFGEGTRPPRPITERFENENWYEAATRFCRMDDVVPNRVDRLKSLGNSIVPQIAYEIFKAIEDADKQI